MATMNGLPGGGQVWRVDGKHYAVYFVPGTNVPLMYHFERSDRLVDATGSSKPKVARNLTADQARRAGAINMGVTAELDHQLGRHPWDSFLAQVERDKDIAPWLNDPEVLAEVADAWLRGEAPNLERTEWWRSKTDAERQWIDKAASNPTQARQDLADNRIRARDLIRAAGGKGVPSQVVNAMADLMTKGHWSETKLMDQVRVLTDPYAPGQVDRKLTESIVDSAKVTADQARTGDRTAIQGGRAQVMDRLARVRAGRGLSPDAASDKIWADRILSAGPNDQGLKLFMQARDRMEGKALEQGLQPGAFGQTREHEDTVQRMVSQWLGPAAGQGWTEEQTRRWAGQLRNDPNAEQNLLDELKRQRLALYPEHENPDLAYEDIAAPWRGFVQQHWGQQADEMDPLFAKLIRQNDAAENLALLRREGLARGVGQVEQDLQSETLRAFGGQVRASAL